MQDDKRLAKERTAIETMVKDRLGAMEHLEASNLEVPYF
jgi:hypothetical protein